MDKVSCRLVLLLLFVGIIVKGHGQLSQAGQMQEYREQCIADLRNLVVSQKEWVKVHAAEFLLWENERVDFVYDVFMKQNELYSNSSPYRIGVWRVLAQAATDTVERQYWVAKIAAVYANLQAIDRLHAVETLSKLGCPVVDPNSLASIASSPVNAFRLYQLWNLTHQPCVASEMVIDQLITDMEQSVGDEQRRSDMMVASYILRYLGPLRPEIWHRISAVSDSVGGDPKLSANLLATLWITCPADIPGATIDRISLALIGLKEEQSAVHHLLAAFATRGSDSRSDELIALYKQLRERENPAYDADIHASAAYAVLSYLNREQE